MTRLGRRALALAIGFGLGAPGLASSQTVIGLVYDSIAGEPLPDAQVYIMGTGLTTTTGDDGRFQIDNVPLGDAVISFFHPRLAAVSANGTPQRIGVAANSTTDVYLAGPSRRTMLATWCLGEQGAGNLNLEGTVAADMGGGPLLGATVQALSDDPELPQDQRVIATARTGASGEYRLCNLDPGQGITIQALFGANSSDPVQVTGSGSQTHDLPIRISAAVTLAGSVTDHTSGDGIEGVTVSLVGAGIATFTGPNGEFRFTNVPPGQQIIETRQLGYTTRTDSLTALGDALGLEIQLSVDAIELDPIVATGQRQRGTGAAARFLGLTEASMDSLRYRVFDFEGVIRSARIPGLRIGQMLDPATMSRQGICLTYRSAGTGRGGDPCANAVAVFIDDVPLATEFALTSLISPSDIASVQFVPPIDAAARYGRQGTNGVLLVYTRRR